jgi:GntR family transcriptional repressor for pyruvate dehydrogenase complex
MSSKPDIEVNPVKKENLPEKIIREIKHLIHSGQIAPGSRLPGERTLANLLKVSRSSLREALKALSILGVIENRHGDGNFISASPDDWPMEPLSIFLSVKRGAMIDLIEARQGLEIAVAELAAQRRTADDIEGMSQSILKMQHSQDRPSQFYQDDLEFHQHLAAAAKNPVIEDLLEKIYALSNATRTEIHQFDRHFYAYIAFDISEHEKLFLSIKNRNPTEAVACMSRHMKSLKQRYLEMDA